jgi:outer membrane protein OmpA-like peptidoglycan-associated protein
MALCLLAATAGPAFAQDETADVDAMAEEVMEETMEDATEEMADEIMIDEAMTDEVMEDEVMEDETMADEAMADEVMADEVTEDETMADEAMADEAMADDAMADEVMEDVPSLEEIAASDPALDVRTNAEGEVDAMVMLSDVLFSFGDASLEPAALDVLRGVAEKLDGVPSIEITGHTDAVGDEGYNLALGQRRAEAVREWLVANTVLTADVVSARGVGEVDPIAPNLTDDGVDSPEGRAQNRRVEFTLPDTDEG